LKSKYNVKQINYRNYNNCRNFFNFKCIKVQTNGEVADIETLEEFSTRRFTYDNESKCYYFESDDDAVWFRLKYGV